MEDFNMLQNTFVGIDPIGRVKSLEKTWLRFIPILKILNSH